MKEGRIIIPEKIYVLNIKTLKGNIESGSDIEQEQIKGYNFTHTLGTGINEEEKLIALKLAINIEAFGEDEQLLDIKASYTHSFTFMVENMEEFLGKDEAGTISEVDPILVSALIGIAYSTVRGIIFTRTQSTALNAVILPVIDPKELLKLDDGNVKP